MKKTLFSFVLAFVLGAGVNLQASVIDSGTCGASGNETNVTWELTSDGLLTISGTGAMADYSIMDDEPKAPWDSYKSSSYPKITSIIVNRGVTTIGNYALYGFSFVTSISLPEGLTRIGMGGINACQSLESLTLPSTLSVIESNAFTTCKKLTTLTIPAAVEYIQAPIFDGFVHITDLSVESGNKRYNSPKGSNAIIETNTNTLIQGCAVTVMPEYITAIGDYAFQYDDFTSITIPSSVKTIAYSAFMGCSQLQELTCEAVNPPAIEDSWMAFYDVSRDIPVYVPEASIDAYQKATVWKDFTNIQAIKKVEPKPCSEDKQGTCGKSLTWLLTCDDELIIQGSGAMEFEYGAPWASDSTLITSISLPEGLTTIADNAFLGFSNPKLTTLTIPESVYLIGEHALDIQYLSTLYAKPYTMAPGRGKQGDSELFPNHADDLKIYVPANQHEMYIYAWGPYAYYMRAYDYVAGEEMPSAQIKPIASGTCGTDVHWEIYNDYCLRICGPGRKMADYAKASDQPWTEYSDRILSVWLEDRITNVGANAFAGLSKLNLVPLTKAVTTIGNYAFKNCTSLSMVYLPNILDGYSVDIPEGVETIGDEVFYNCSNEYLTQMRLPSTLTSLGANNFVGCTNVYKVLIQAAHVPALASSSEPLPANLFIWCPTRSRTEYANAVNWIDWWDKLLDQDGDHLPLPSGSGACGEEATWKFEMEKEASAPIRKDGADDWKLANYKGILTINGSGAMNDYLAASAPWYAYKKVTSDIKLPKGLTKIGDNAFDGFGNNVTSITCEAQTPPTVGENAFGDIPATTKVNVPDTEAYKDAQGWSTMDIEPMGEEPKPCSDDKQGTCGDNLKWVLTCDGELIITGSGAMTDFNYNNRAPWTAFNSLIKSVSLPNGLTHVGAWSIYQIEGVKSIVIPEGVTSIGYVGFAGCRNLESVSLPSSLESISSMCFQATAIRSLVIPAGVSTIGEGITEECESLETIIVDKDNKVFDNREDCNAIIKTANNTLIAGCKTTLIPNTVTAIGNSAFSSISNIGDVRIPNSVESIGNYAFQYCSSFKALVIPTSLTSISGSAFTGCTFTTIKVIPGNPKFDSRDNCNAIIETATNKLVKGCENTVMPEGITTFGEGAFMSNNNLKFISIPASVESLERNALIYCKNLEAITSFASEPPVADALAFNYGAASSISIKPDIPVYVPGASIEAYKAAANWSYFTNFVALDNYYTVKALATHGAVTGTGTYAAGTNISLKAVADEGFEFLEWTDGTNANPKELTVTKDETVRALFKMLDVEEEVAALSYQADIMIISWDAIDQATIYIVNLYKEGKLFASYKTTDYVNFIEIETYSPAPLRARRSYADEQPGKISIQIEGLEYGADYSYSIDAYNEQEEVVNVIAGSFNTAQVPTDAEQLTNANAPRKQLRDGKLMIVLPDGKRFDATGAKM